jgi:hypothetical protein
VTSFVTRTFGQKESSEPAQRFEGIGAAAATNGRSVPQLMGCPDAIDLHSAHFDQVVE